MRYPICQTNHNPLRDLQPLANQVVYTLIQSYYHTRDFMDILSCMLENENKSIWFGRFYILHCLCAAFSLVNE